MDLPLYHFAWPRPKVTSSTYLDPKSAMTDEPHKTSFIKSVSHPIPISVAAADASSISFEISSPHKSEKNRNNEDENQPYRGGVHDNNQQEENWTTCLEVAA